MARRTLQDLLARDAEEREAEQERETELSIAAWEAENQRLADQFYGDGPRPGFCDMEAQEDAMRHEMSDGFYGSYRDDEHRATYGDRYD